MSLLKWKEIANQKSELGKEINSLKEVIKQKKITDQIGQDEAQKLFQPITSSLNELSLPKTPLNRRLNKKKDIVPDYGINIDDEVPDYQLQDLFVEPQNNKQLVPKPPSYEDVLKDIASGEKKIHINPEFLLEENDENLGPNYNIFEEDEINQTLDKLNIPNYDDIELRLKEEDMHNNKRKSYLNKILKNAKEQRAKLSGYSTDVTKKLKNGLISQPEAQYRRKIIMDTRKVLNEYIGYNKQRLTNFEGSGFNNKRIRNKRKQGGQIQFFNNPAEMLKKLELIIGSINAGNNSIKLRNTGVALLDILLKNSILNKPQYTKIMKNYFI